MTRKDSRGTNVRVPGFSAAGICCGIKQDTRDLALIVSDRPASVAGVFTRSTVVGAPVEWCREQVRAGTGRGVVVNSGVSNVAMGARGRRDARAMATLAARATGCRPEHFFVASTGKIGEPLPMAKLRTGIPAAARQLSPGGLEDAAEAIRTTDTFTKIASARVRLDAREITLVGIAKGSGMIEPNMATMLGFLVTDALVSPAFLRRVLREATDRSFNRVTVDGETSTSDSVLLFANGAAGNARLTGPSARGASAFASAVTEVSESLARDLARDGEGATKLVTVEVTGAASPKQAEQAARRVANSMLVKTAIFGGDPNWGRILQTIGAARVELREERAVVKLCGVPVFRAGASAGPAARRKAAKGLAKSDVSIEVALGVGRASARIWTCDLTHDYIRINSLYS